MRVTAVAPAGSRPVLLEDNRRADSERPGISARRTRSCSRSTTPTRCRVRRFGRPSRPRRSSWPDAAKPERPAWSRSGTRPRALTRPRDSKSDVARVLETLSTDAEIGTALYDAVELSVARLQRMSNGTRILVLLTDGRDRGSRSTLAKAIASAQRANVIVYAIAAGAGCRPRTARRARLGHRRQAVQRVQRDQPRRGVPHAEPGARPHVAALVHVSRTARETRSASRSRRGLPRARFGFRSKAARQASFRLRSCRAGTRLWASSLSSRFSSPAPASLRAAGVEVGDRAPARAARHAARAGGGRGSAVAVRVAARMDRALA